MTRSAISTLFLSCISMWLLPLMPELRQVHHLRVTACGLHLVDERLARIVRRLPVHEPPGDVAQVIAEHHQRRNLRELRDLRVGQSRRARLLDRDHAADARGIDQRRLLREEAALGVPHQHGAVQAASRARPCWSRSDSASAARRSSRESSACRARRRLRSETGRRETPRRTSARTETPSTRPGGSPRGCRAAPTAAARRSSRRRSRSNRSPSARATLGPRDRRCGPAHEVFVPAHAAVGRRLPRLAAQAAAVNHDDGHVPIAAHRDLILHVHLVDHDLAAAERGAGRRRRLRQLLLLAADEETALARDRQRPVRSLRSGVRRSTRKPPRRRANRASCVRVFIGSPRSAAKSGSLYAQPFASSRQRNEIRCFRRAVRSAVPVARGEHRAAGAQASTGIHAAVRRHARRSDDRERRHVHDRRRRAARRRTRRLAALSHRSCATSGCASSCGS